MSISKSRRRALSVMIATAVAAQGVATAVPPAAHATEVSAEQQGGETLAKKAEAVKAKAVRVHKQISDRSDAVTTEEGQKEYATILAAAETLVKETEALVEEAKNATSKEDMDALSDKADALGTKADRISQDWIRILQEEVVRYRAGIDAAVKRAEDALTVIQAAYDRTEDMAVKKRIASEFLNPAKEFVAEARHKQAEVAEIERNQQSVFRVESIRDALVAANSAAGKTVELSNSVDKVAGKQGDKGSSIDNNLALGLGIPAIIAVLVGAVALLLKKALSMVGKH
ncbi:hypothetical protein [Corynebacterium timonense]|uniref:Uncharacterized protein n=1 Tax=Corynebacterium timonense TaxID=441500 RepID=A0A1H1P5I5_9CORY|nr:hypothetical protein [Corynebacterium timonense]SDS06462.1 hypothetical protein SAMN04488539_0934 [Corynebacterium timonense]